MDQRQRGFVFSLSDSGGFAKVVGVFAPAGPGFLIMGPGFFDPDVGVGTAVGGGDLLEVVHLQLVERLTR